MRWEPPVTSVFTPGAGRTLTACPTPRLVTVTANGYVVYSGNTYKSDAELVQYFKLRHRWCLNIVVTERR